MFTSIDPQPAENEIECARCGVLIFDQLTRCPNCGVNLYEPEEYEPPPHPEQHRKPGLLDRAGLFLRRVLGKPYTAEHVFGDALDQAALYNDLLGKVGGEHTVAERLIEYERQQQPGATRRTWLENAIRRWERDNYLGTTELLG